MPTKPAKIGQSCYASGWGEIDNYCKAKELMVAPLELLGYDGCYHALKEQLIFFSRDKYQMYLEQSLRWDLCTSNMPKSICEGDSGGPFTCDEHGKAVIHGISSKVMSSGIQLNLKSCHTFVPFNSF